MGLFYTGGKLDCQNYLCYIVFVMKHYSFEVNAPREIAIPSQHLWVGPGRDMFTTAVENLDAFKAHLSELEIEVVNVVSLDEDPNLVVDETKKLYLEGLKLLG